MPASSRMPLSGAGSDQTLRLKGFFVGAFMTDFRKEPPHSAQCLNDIFLYDPESGFLHWRKDRAFKTKSGNQAGTLTPNGYVKIRMDGVGYFAHRVIWAIKTGEWPSSFIDHIDGDRANNRFENLRLADAFENQQNRVKVRGSSKYLGVHWNKKTQKWRASIGINKRCIWIGDFDTQELASDAYLQSKSRLHTFQPCPRNLGESAHG